MMATLDPVTLMVGQSVQADVLTQVVLPISLFIIMLGMGLALKVADFSRVLQYPKAFTLGIACQMMLLPLIGLAVIYLFGLSRELAVGLMVLSFCPGGVTSNLLSYLSRGDVALSISLTAIVSLVTPFTIPLLTALTMEFFLVDATNFSLPIVKTIIQLTAITIVPVCIGMAIHNKWPKFSRAMDKPIKIFSIAFLFIIIAAIVLKNQDDMAGYFIQTGAASLSLNLLALALGFGVAKLAKLDKPQAITIGIEVGLQNGTLALLVTGTLLGSAVMTIPAVTYSLLMFFSGALFGRLVNQKW